jgi:phosphatidylserine decarboxylase
MTSTAPSTDTAQHRGSSRRSRTDDPAPPIAPEGLPIVAIFVAFSVVLTGLATWLLWPLGALVGLPCLLLTLWCLWFFRDPQRTIPDEPGALVSPADGVVCQITPAAPPPELGLSANQTAGMMRVAVFMNVFNVHVNRAPLAGVVERVEHHHGKFLNASFDKASDLNERLSLLLRLPDGQLLPCVQIAGLVARRIVCRVAKGATLKIGERYGLIRFGSRVDVYLPAGSEVLVKIGDRCVAGETILARLASAPDRNATGVDRVPQASAT